ncbi:unnamed protein product, partial [Coregonus sp. 'balchen']
MHFRLAVVQLHVTKVKADNLSRARGLISEAAGHGAKVVVLPECFNSPYGTGFFPGVCREDPWRIQPDSEDDGGKLYNTCPVFGPDGSLVLKHRKIHLFDIDVPGKIRFQ